MEQWRSIRCKRLLANALMFWAAASLLSGFNVTGFGAALIGSLIYSLAGIVIDAAMERLFSPATA